MHEQNNVNGQGEAQRFAEAIAIANVPTLLMVLVQLTGDLRWLEEPYRSQRARGMGDNDTGGLPEPIQAEVRQAALEAILAWRAGRPVAIPEPSSDLRLKMLSWTMAEKVPAEYDQIIAAELLLEEHDVIEKLPVPEGFEVLIIGAGECRQDVHDAYNERIDQAHENMVWTHPGMETYYRNARGRVVVNSPYRNATFYEMTRAANLDDFIVEPRQA